MASLVSEMTRPNRAATSKSFAMLVRSRSFSISNRLNVVMSSTALTCLTNEGLSCLHNSEKKVCYCFFFFFFEKKK